MKATIEAVEGLYLIRIYEREGRLYDVYVVDELELEIGDYERNPRVTLSECTL